MNIFSNIILNFLSENNEENKKIYLDILLLLKEDKCIHKFLN